MSNDLVSIYNQALSSIGARSSVSSPSEASLEREQCELWYATVRDQVLRAAPWPSAKGYQRLAQLQERDFNEDWAVNDPQPGYRFAFSYPSDMIWPRHLDNFARFSLGRRGAQRAIMANDPKALLFYTVRLENIAQWDAGMRMAIVHGLGAAVCEKLTGKTSLAQRIEGKANDLILTAREQAANSEMESYEAMPEWFTARGFSQFTQTKFIFENGVMLNNTGVLGAR